MPRCRSIPCFLAFCGVVASAIGVSGVPRTIVAQTPTQIPTQTSVSTSTPSSAAPASSPRRTDLTAGVDERYIRLLLAQLADDSMQGRGTGTPGIRKAARLIAREMQAIGLQPVGDSGYAQRVPLDIGRQGAPSAPVGLASWAAYDSLPDSARVVDANMVGILRGSDSTLRDQYVLIDAHYDHLGIGSPVDGDSIYNGADDDGSGTVAVLAIARALASGPRPKRSIIFTTMTGEELGLLGTNWYIAHPAIPLDHVVANLEIEMIGRPDSLAGGEGKAWLTGYEHSSMGPSFAAAGLAVVADPRPRYDFYQRSDNIAFAQAGIPAHTLSSYNLHGDYHRPSDDVTHIDFPHMTAVIRTAVAAVRLLADGPVPTWAPNGKP